ncbi:MAG TPA: methyl-accepting chemotaxis protein [Clostridiaceae bacterium]|nr:methyl-accepting chemotaxis protein [Clostridiaceae bacterium]
MGKSDKKRFDIAKYALIISISVGLIFAIVTCIMTGEWMMLPYFALSGIITALVLRILVNISIRKITSRFASELELIKEGDFSHLVDSKSYGALSGASSIVNSVLSDIRVLIDGFFTLSKSIVQASRKVSLTSQEASTAIMEISRTVDEIAKGASEQASEAQLGVQMVEKLADQINSVFETYNNVMKETSRISELNKIGLDSVNTLHEKSEENFKTSERIFAVVEKLTNTIKDIGIFVESIENIAEQTNLLALNAAIEAARAGDAGKGFAVVADEVRKLADESRKSTEEISDLMESIQEEAMLAIESMEDLRKASLEQNEAVNQTKNSFHDIADAITSIVEKIKDVNDAVETMQHNKNEVISAIETISSVSEETAASSQEVAATTEHQLKAIEDLKIAAEGLDNLVKQLDARLKKYKLR